MAASFEERKLNSKLEKALHWLSPQSHGNSQTEEKESLKSHNHVLSGHGIKKKYLVFNFKPLQFNSE